MAFDSASEPCPNPEYPPSTFYRMNGGYHEFHLYASP